VAGVREGLLALGDEVTWEAWHLGIRRRLTARIIRLERPASFEDVMIRGGCATFRHVHEFIPRGGGTTMVYTFTFASPLGPLGSVVDVSRASELKRMAESP
jgi:ligand-binding SRPBCC domain-containing protein